VEDSLPDVFLIREAIERTGIHVMTDNEQATQCFDETDCNDAVPCPALVILDINLPKKHGGEVLQHVRASRRCNHALVIVLSSSDLARERDTVMELGADAFFRKPSEYDEFLKLGDLIRSLLPAAPEPIH